MVLAATVGRADAGLPVLRNFFTGASQQFMQIRVSGNLQNPDIRQEAFPGVNQALKNLDHVKSGVPRTDEHRTYCPASPAAWRELPWLRPGVPKSTVPSRRAPLGELRARSEQKAEMAAGVGQTDGDNHQTAERDADGRRLWEFPQRRRRAGRRPRRVASPQGQDPTGQSGSMLDLSG